MTHGMSFVAFDVETANNDRGSMCAAGVTMVVGGQIVDEREWLFRPTEPVNHFDPRNVGVHGIGPEHVADAPHAMQVFPEIAAYLSGHFVIAHNAAFDMSSLRATSEHLGMAYPSLSYGCTLVMSRKVLGLSSNGLAEVTTHLGLDAFNHHDAGADSRAAAMVMLALAQRHGASDMATALDLIGVTPGVLSPGESIPCRKRSGSTSRRSAALAAARRPPQQTAPASRPVPTTQTVRPQRSPSPEVPRLPPRGGLSL